VLPVRDVLTEERMGLDPQTSRILWSRGAASDLSFEPLPPTSWSPAPAGHDGDRLTGVDRTTGRTRWSYEVEAARRVQFVAAGDVVAAVVVDPPAATFEQVPEVGVAIHLLSAATGELEHQAPRALTTAQKMQTHALQTVGPQITGSAVVLDVGELVAVDVHTGVER
jgi:hypothetical protein